MSHVNVNVPSVTRARQRTVRLSDFTGGVRLARYHEALFDSQSPYMRNMLFKGDILRTRDCAEQVYDDLTPSGEIHSESGGEFFGYRIFHIGTYLLAVNENDRSIISSSMPDAKSFFIEMNSLLYIYTEAARIYTLDKSLKLSETELPERPLMVEAKNDLSSYTECDAPDNLLTGAVSISYLANVTSGITKFTLPHKPDTDLPIRAYNNDTGEELSSSFVISGKNINFVSKQYKAIRISYYPKKGESARDFDKILGCTTAVCYGGRTASGTRVFFSGNPDYPGHFFYSDLMNPFCVSRLSYDIIGNGSKEITALARQKNDLVVFCKDSVHRIIYSFDIDTGPEFTVSEINSTVGCDISGSIQLVDNRLVFANSKKGIFIIVSSDYTDELSVRSVSANINGDSERGFFSIGEGVCCSADYDRKYYLYFGNTGFVWDYGKTPYVLGSDPAYSERILSWYIFDGSGERLLYEQGGYLYGICENGSRKRFVKYREGISDLEGDIISEIVTRDLDASEPFSKKTLREMTLSVKAAEDAFLCITVYGDGEEIISTEYSLDPEDIMGTYGSDLGLCSLRIKLPRFEAIRFSVRLSLVGGILGVHGLQLVFGSDEIKTR